MKIPYRISFAIATLVAVICAPCLNLHAQTAFPGAYGFGANATGGRGGSVYHVTNLNDSGPGSFRDAVSTGNRIVIFDVGGYIVLKSAVSVSSNLTIAGQTAPGGGIGIMAGEVSLSGKTNIILRNVRIRQGNQDPQTGKSALNMGAATNIILDHCSFEYGQWDSVDAVGTVNFTVQNSIIADPIGQQFGAHVETGPSTFYRNLWVNAHNRQPLSKDNTQYINNVIYDYQYGYTAANTGGYFSHDLVNNYFIAGPETASPADAFFQMNNKQSVYATGNFIDGNFDGVLNGSLTNTAGSSLVLSAPWAPTTTSIPTLSASDAYTSIVASSGAFPRDSVDDFVLGDVISLGLTGQLYKDQAVTGLANNGYGTIAGNTPFTETSNDGIADYWATANDISITDPSASGATYGETGYTNLEVYVNSLVLPAPWKATDLANTPLQGASSYNPFTSQWLLSGSGASSQTTLDTGQFTSQSWNTDGTFTAQLLTLAGADPEATGGVMLRNSLSQTSAFVALVANSAGGIAFLSRSSDGQTAEGVQINNIAKPLWLRIVRKAGTYAGYSSPDGVKWTLLGVANVALPSTVQAGLIMASGSATTLGTASFTNVSLTADTGSAVTLENTSSSLIYPESTNLTATVSASGAYTPIGSVQIFDGSNSITTQPLQGDGKAYWYIQPSLNAGTHLLTAAYAGDLNTPAGFSPAISITVASTPSMLSASCWNTDFPYGANYSCTANVSSNAGSPSGALMHYTVDGAGFDVPLNNGSSQFSITKPDAGSHIVTLSFAAQGNFAASQTLTETFSVTPAPTQIALTPSSYYQSASNPMLLSVAISSWTSTPPTSGTITIYDGGIAAGSSPISSNSTASFSLSGLAAGTHSFTASFEGNTDFASGTSPAIAVQLY